MNKLSAFRFIALPLLLIVGFFVGFGSGTILAAAFPAVQTHDTSQAAMPAVATACPNTGLTGAALQEDKLFCNPAVVIYAPCTPAIIGNGGLIYTAAIGAANRHIMVGSPEQCGPSVDWSGLPLVAYVHFGNGNFHAEMHGDNVVRIYDTSGGTNRQVYP
jgi:hypothetical protein